MDLSYPVGGQSAYRTQVARVARYLGLVTQ
jgi:hypothetical protein